MKTFSYILAVTTLALVSEAATLHKGGHHHQNSKSPIPQPTIVISSAVALASVPTAASAVAATGAVARGAQTQVLFEVGGVPGNECLTFRNNGEIVDAACVNTSSDRQLTPSTLGSQSVLLVQRSFDAGFRPDLVGVQACVGFNGTDFKAEPCGAAGITEVSFVGGELTAGAACASGHDGKAQLTVDVTGKTCAKYTVTDVAAAAA